MVRFQYKINIIFKRTLSGERLNITQTQYSFRSDLVGKNTVSNQVHRTQYCVRSSLIGQLRKYNHMGYLFKSQKSWGQMYESSTNLFA